MGDAGAHDVTQLLAAVADGDSKASEELLPLIYDELRRLAQSYMAREGKSQTLQPTALVHEAYLRLVGAADVTGDGRDELLVGPGTGGTQPPLTLDAQTQAKVHDGGNFGGFLGGVYVGGNG